MDEHDQVLFNDAELRTADPGKDYVIRHENQLGTGGFAKVFKV